MKPRKTITGQNAEDILQQINYDFASGTGLHDYHVHLQHGERIIELNIVSSPGGSDEGGYDFTTLKATLPANTGFLFAIHPEDVLNKIGKFFGMQDITTGYAEFDKMVVVKTNDEQKVKQLFADEEVRQPFQNLSGYSFKIVHHSDKGTDNLELHIQRAVIDMRVFQPVFNAFMHVLSFLDKKETAASFA